MRERHDGSLKKPHYHGITPAYAGKTAEEIKSMTMPRDHPRVCGKDLHSKQLACLQMGSPPRMRERPFKAERQVAEERITPAYAGKTAGVGVKSTFNGDHPRVCGKDGKNSIFLFASKGSPPRMRERPLLCLLTAVTLRITPAYAGKTLKIPIKMAISITETVKFHLLFKFNLSQNMVQQYFIFMK